MGYIYMIENQINGKKYIGKTDRDDPYIRFKEHIYNSRQQNGEYDHYPLYRAINKYGVENFTFNIIEETDNTSEREIYWIAYYNTYYGDGYNATLGGDGIKVGTKKIKRNRKKTGNASTVKRLRIKLDEDAVIDYYINVANRTMLKTAQYFNVCIKVIRRILVENNIPITDAAEIGKRHSHAVVQLDMDTLELIKIHDSIRAANRFFGKDERNATIRGACKNLSKTAYGYRWMSYDEYLELN